MGGSAVVYTWACTSDGGIFLNTWRLYIGDSGIVFALKGYRGDSGVTYTSKRYISEVTVYTWRAYTGNSGRVNTRTNTKARNVYKGDSEIVRSGIVTVRFLDTYKSYTGDIAHLYKGTLYVISWQCIIRVWIHDTPTYLQSQSGRLLHVSGGVSEWS